MTVCLHGVKVAEIPSDRPPVGLDGSGLRLVDVAEVARCRRSVELTSEVRQRLQASWAVAERAADRGDSVYGLTTGVGALKRVAVDPHDAAIFNERLIETSRVAQEPWASEAVVRATLLRLANGFAHASACVRPELVDRVLTALQERWPLRMRLRGSVGLADLGPMADLVTDLVRGVDLAPGEGLALVSNNALSIGHAALAVHDAVQLADVADVAGALSLEGFAANLSILHPVAASSRPHPGLSRTHRRLRGLLAGSRLWQPGAARNLQDPLTFRCLPQIHGALREGLDHATEITTTELNSAQGNPQVLVDEDAVVSVGNVDPIALASAIDYARSLLVSMLTASAERTVKLLQAPWSGLPSGLAVDDAPADDGLSELGLAAQSLTSEARQLATPVAFDVVSTTQAESIEDRATMAPLAARRLAEVIELGQRVLAIELVVAARAVDHRGLGPSTLGAGTAAAHRCVHEHAGRPGGQRTLPDVEAMAAAVRDGHVPSQPHRSDAA